tara:strand:+ start:195 stop:662 length:468 start_codon:yes stop_codon:yes gene_type:complete
MIVSMCRNRGIGLNQIIPGLHPTELNIFKSLIVGKGNNTVIWGKNAFLRNPSFKNCTNIMLSSSTKYNNPFTNTYTVSHLDQINMEKFDDVWIVGGASVFKHCLNSSVLKEIHILENNRDFFCNVFLPELPSSFKLAIQNKHVEKETTIYHKVYR